MPRRKKVDPQVAESHRLLAGERRQLDHRGDQLRDRRGGDGDRAARDGVTDQHRRAAQVADQGDQVAGDVGARVGRPLSAGLPTAAQIHRGDTVTSLDQGGDEEAVSLPAVAHAVSGGQKRTCRAGQVEGKSAAFDGQEFGYVCP